MRGCTSGARGYNSKFQIPNSKGTPNSKLQTDSKLQTPKVVWSCFEFAVWSAFGVWTLEFGIDEPQRSERSTLNFDRLIFGFSLNLPRRSRSEEHTSELQSQSN